METNNFIKKSRLLLYYFLSQPGGLSFFPGEYFWKKLEESFYSIVPALHFSSHKKQLYVHIPFCDKICTYCNCFKKQLISPQEVDVYLDYIEKEAELYFGKGESKIAIESIFIGGGTPNILSKPQMERLFLFLSKTFAFENKEFCVDCHPEFLNQEKIFVMKKYGVTRVTLAVQSLENDVLKKHNRGGYDSQKCQELIYQLKSENISVNIDLLFGLNGQSFELMKSDIDFFVDCGVDNISDHYFMKSNNFFYILDQDYHQSIKKIKEYVSILPKNSPNIQESNDISQQIDTISLGSDSVTHFYERGIYKKAKIQKYYKMLDQNIHPFEQGVGLTKRDEMIRFIYLHILSGICVKTFYNLFQENIFHVFASEWRFLSQHNIIEFSQGKILKKQSDQQTLIFANIFFIKYFSSIALQDVTLTDYFFSDGDLIDK